VPIDWYADESFQALLARTVKITKAQLKEGGDLVLVGSSAGGSLAVNIVGELHDSHLSAVTLCSRLHEAPLKWWDRRNLTRMAHIGSKHPAQAFYDSVIYCGTTTIPKLIAKDKQRVIITQQWADFVVPRQTMDIPDVRIYRVSGLGHGWGIAMAARHLPKIIESLPLAGRLRTDRSAQSDASVT
jgi:hypothetical protein